MAVAGIGAKVVDAVRFLQQPVRRGLKRGGFSVEFARQSYQGVKGLPGFQVAPVIGG